MSNMVLKNFNFRFVATESNLHWHILNMSVPVFCVKSRCTPVMF